MTPQEQGIIILEGPNWIPIISALIGAGAIIVAAWLGYKGKK